MDSSTITLSKLEAASRQLRTAITLWFDEGDPVSVHTLAFAAYEIFHTVSAHRDPYRRDLLFDSDWIKDEYRRDWNKHIRREANFFKHGDRDPEGSIDSIQIFQTGLSFSRRMHAAFVANLKVRRKLCLCGGFRSTGRTSLRKMAANSLRTASRKMNLITSGHSINASFEKCGAKPVC
jgi:hypothetical protein